MLRKKPDKIVTGLDIGSDCIKMVRGRKENGKIRVLNFGYRKFSAFEATADFFSRQMQELLSSQGAIKEIKKDQVNALISGRKLCIRVVKLPMMPEAEIHQAIKSKIRKYVSQNLEQVEFSFLVLGETQEKGIKKLDVAFIATQKSLLNQYMQFFKLIGAEPDVISSACFSEWNLVKEAGLDKDVAALMLINIEPEQTDLAVYREGRFIFTRNISIGVKNLTNITGSQTQLALEQADVFYREIEMTTHHYYQITHGRRIDKCIVLGEGAQISSLVDFLRQKSETATENFYLPEEKLQFSADQEEEFRKNLPLYTQALGALLIEPNDINLLTMTKKQSKVGFVLVRTLALGRTAFAVGMIFMVLGLSIFGFFKGTNLYYHRQIKSCKERREKLQNRTIQLMQIRRKIDILDFEKALYLQLIKERPEYPLIIAQICQAIPSEKTVLDELVFNSIRQKKGAAQSLTAIEFNIKGRVLGKDALSSETTNFVLSLEQSGYFDNISVTIDERQRAGETDIEGHLGFTINGIIRVEG